MPGAPDDALRADAGAAPSPVPAAQTELARPEGPSTQLPTPDVPSEPFVPELGAELLSRLPALSTPPMLGRLGGLPAMAQTLPAVDRFLQSLPVPPPQPILPSLGTAEFAASLPALAGYGEPGASPRTPAFPAQLQPPSEPTDVLAPPGGMPGQIAGLSGAAAILEPVRPPAVPPVVVPSTAREAPAATSTPAVPPVQRTGEPGTPATIPALGLARPAPPAITPPAPVAPAWPQPPATITQVLPLGQTLTANILPDEEAPAPIQRQALPALGEDWSSPAELVQPADRSGERVSAEQRAAIESQRGQGRPLEPETRQRFEQAYGQPLADVRIHTGPTADATAASLNAIAFASGSDLFFTQNTYAPDSPQGLTLIGHELAHVIQQQYGVAGDGDELRPADDRYERQADVLAARALEAPFAQAPLLGTPTNPNAAVQRSPDDEQRLSSSSPGLPAASTWAPGAQLRAADERAAPPQTLATAPALGSRLPEDEPIQRVAAGSPLAGAGMPNIIRDSRQLTTSAASEALPPLQSAPQRIGSLTEQLLNPSVMTSGRDSLSQSLPGLGSVSAAGQGLPVFRRINLPGLGSLPRLPQNLPDLSSTHLPDTSALTDQVPAMPSLPSLPSGLPSLGSSALAMPDLGVLAQSLGGTMPGLPALPAGLPSLSGLTPPEMPLAEGVGAAGQAASDALGGAASSAMAAGQQALGTITGMASSGGEAAAAAPALPSLDKLTEHIWKEVQRKLKVERERSRGLA